MTASEANRQRMLSSLNTEREEVFEQFRYIDVTLPVARRGTPPMSENRRLSFYERRDRNELNDL
jgi:hypothetical protein